MNRLITCAFGAPALWVFALLFPAVVLASPTRVPLTQAEMDCHRTVLLPSLNEDAAEIQDAFFARLHYLNTRLKLRLPYPLHPNGILSSAKNRLVDWDSLPFMRLASRPDLQQLTNRALKKFESHGHHFVLEHIRGQFDEEMHPELRVKTLRMDSGGHLLPSWDELLKETFRSLPIPVRSAIDAEVGKMDEAAQEAVVRKWAEMGLQSRDTEWPRFLLPEAREITVHYHRNSAYTILLPRHLYTHYGWNGSIKAARRGSCPIGGKSIFPSSWNAKQIRKGIVSVLKNPQSQVLRETTEQTSVADDGTVVRERSASFYLRGTYNNVVIDVGITGPKAGTAFPAWLQQPPKNIRLLYLQWHVALQTLRRVQTEVHSRVLDELRAEGTLRNRRWEPLPIPEMIELHLGYVEQVTRRNRNVAVDRWIRYLDPSVNHFEGLEGRRAKISSFLMLDRLATEVESLSW